MPNFHEISNETNPQSVISKYINKYCKETGRNVIVYNLQDLILSVHHACMDFFNKNEDAIKLLANNQKKFFMQ